jgi:cytidylate kinase
MIEKQMRNWEFTKSRHPQHPASGAKLHEFVTLSQSVGAGGDVIAQRLADALGWPLFDKKLLLVMAHDDVVRAQIYASLDERDMNWIEEMTRILMEADFRKNDYFHRLTETVLCLARQSHAVFLGRGTDQILPKGSGLRVRIVAPRAERIARYSRQHNLTEKDAIEEIGRIEQEQAQWLKHHFHIARDDCERFDLVVNAGTFSVEQATQFILGAMKKRGIATHLSIPDE